MLQGVYLKLELILDLGVIKFFLDQFFLEDFISFLGLHPLLRFLIQLLSQIDSVFSLSLLFFQQVLFDLLLAARTDVSLK